MLCVSCGRDAPRVKVVFEKDDRGRVRKEYGCCYCKPWESVLLPFNFHDIGARVSPHMKKKYTRITAAHEKDIRSRRAVVYDWDKRHVRSGVERDRGRVTFDMGRK